jgi:DNA-binding HxlR family transcriptional regulator
MTGRPFGLICPISRACEFLQPRWTIQILTELWNGSTRFNDIRKGLGNISSALLSKRLKEMEELGLVKRVENMATGSIDYIRTEKSIDLEPAMNALAEWAQRNIEAEIALSGADLSTVMWSVRRMIVLAELPRRRAVIRFHFREDPPPKNPHFWLLVEPGADMPELCYRDPGRDVDLYVETNSVSLGAILEGRASIDAEKQDGTLFLSGDPVLARSMDHWLRTSVWAAVEGIIPLSQRPR